MMKKIVKPLIAAAAAAAIVGVSAVSFAAWTAGTNNTKDVENNTLGTVSVLQFDTEVTSNAVTNLLPIDQNTDAWNATTNPLYGVIEFDIDVSDGYAYTDFKLEVKYTTTDTYDSNTKFYVSNGTSAPSAVADGHEIDKTTGYTLEYDIKETGTYQFYIFHDSSALGDMGNGFNLTLTLKEGTTAVSGS